MSAPSALLSLKRESGMSRAQNSKKRSHFHQKGTSSLKSTVLASSILLPKSLLHQFGPCRSLGSWGRQHGRGGLCALRVLNRVVPIITHYHTRYKSTSPWPRTGEFVNSGRNRPLAIIRLFPLLTPVFLRVHFLRVRGTLTGQHLHKIRTGSEYLRDLPD